MFISPIRGKPLLIRPLTADDVPNIPRLLATEGATDAESRQRVQDIVEQLFPRLFLRTPNSEPDIHGLVSVADDETLTGMIGTIARRFQFRGQPIRAAVSAELFVAPMFRSKMLGVTLLKRLIDGPQDLSFSDIANDNSRRIWECLGGTVAAMYGMNWVKVLRPGLLPLSKLRDAPLGNALAWTARPAARLADVLLRRATGSFTKLNPPRPVREEILTPTLFLQLFPLFAGDDELSPVYDAETLAWVWHRLDFMYRDGGGSEQVLLSSPRGEPLGWYIYQLSDVGIARVSQIVAHTNTIGQVMDHLLHRAASRGAVAVIGRVMPRYLQAICDRHCLMLRRSRSTIVHSRNPKIVDAFVNGRAFLSLLEGEGPLQIWNNPQLALERLRNNALDNTARTAAITSRTLSG